MFRPSFLPGCNRVGILQLYVDTRTCVRSFFGRLQDFSFMYVASTYIHGTYGIVYEEPHPPPDMKRELLVVELGYLVWSICI